MVVKIYYMFKCIQSYIWNGTNQDQWKKWLDWQRQQAKDHYKHSSIYDLYITQYPQSDLINNQINNTYNQKYYAYCFGSFKIFIVDYSVNLHEYIKILVLLYDHCKGINRRITGDAEGIQNLRKYLETLNIDYLYDYNFTQYNYDYMIIHAHTVACFSLSTLILRIVSHYLHFMSQDEKYPYISAEKCKQACNNNAFPYNPIRSNYINQPKLSKPIQIQSEIVSSNNKVASWPLNIGQNLTIRCLKCNRVTDKLWGSFNVCYDCHMKRICSTCGSIATGITNDNLPKCNNHI